MESNNSNCFKGIQSDKQSITEYINEQKELFLLEVTILFRVVGALKNGKVLVTGASATHWNISVYFRTDH